MNKRTLKALKGSIQKWHEIAYHNGEDEGSENCPLCQEFLGEFNISCTGCPVRQHTGHVGCYDTPYQHQWDRAQRYYARLGGYDDELVPTPRIRAAKQQLRKAAIAELEFLITLMPVGEEAEMPDGTIWYCAEE